MMPGSMFRRTLTLRLLALSPVLCILSGCYAPLTSRAIPASTLPEDFRAPLRTGGSPLNLSTLTMTPPRDYLLGPNDILEVTIPGLYEQAEVKPIRVQVMADGTVHLPLVGSVPVYGKNLVDAQRAISAAYAQGFIVEPRISVVLAEKSTTSVLVLGQVKQPGTYALPKYENDIGHALGAAFGLTEDAGDYIEVHRQGHAQQLTPMSSSHQVGRQTPSPSMVRFARLPRTQVQMPHYGAIATDFHGPSTGPAQNLGGPTVPQIFRIPMRDLYGQPLNPRDIVLGPGDVVVVPDRKHEVFYVVGALNTTNRVRFSLGDRERELGIGFILPRDREIDVITAVAMAGYIDPIYSPTTVTVQRAGPDSQPLLIHVDLIAARYDNRETVLVQPGDIIYLNPDHQWWMRRFIDQTLIEAFRTPYAKLFR